MTYNCGENEMKTSPKALFSHTQRQHLGISHIAVFCIGQNGSRLTSKTLEDPKTLGMNFCA